MPGECEPTLQVATLVSGRYAESEIDSREYQDLVRLLECVGPTIDEHHVSR